MALENDSDEKTQHALLFLQRLNAVPTVELAKMMEEDIGARVIDTMASFAESSVDNDGPLTVANMKDVTRAMIMIGYLLRASEEREEKDFLTVDILMAPGSGKYRQ